MTAPRRAWVVVVLMTMVGVAAAVWVVPSARSRAAVEVLPRSMHCGRHAVPYRIIDTTTDVPHPAFDVTLRPDSFCQLEITFVNTGSRTVHLDTATFPGMGAARAGSGGPLEITQNGGRFTQRDSGTTEDGDAVLPIDEDLDPDGSISMLFDLRTRASAFLGMPGRSVGYEDVPAVRLSAGHLPGTIHGSVDLRIREER